MNIPEAHSLPHQNFEAYYHDKVITLFAHTPKNIQQALLDEFELLEQSSAKEILTLIENGIMSIPDEKIKVEVLEKIGGWFLSFNKSNAKADLSNQNPEKEIINMLRNQFVSRDQDKGNSDRLAA